MKTSRFARLAGLLIASICLAAQLTPAAAADGDRYLGTWAGVWSSNDSSGHFQLMLERSSDGKITGTISVSQDGGGNADYSAKLKSAAFAGDKFTAAYEPPDSQTEINLKGVFTPMGADGDWSLGAKDQPTAAAAASGTWKILKQ